MNFKKILTVFSLAGLLINPLFCGEENPEEFNVQTIKMESKEEKPLALNSTLTQRFFMQQEHVAITALLLTGFALKYAQDGLEGGVYKLTKHLSGATLKGAAFQWTPIEKLSAALALQATGYFFDYYVFSQPVGFSYFTTAVALGLYKGGIKSMFKQARKQKKKEKKLLEDAEKVD